MGNHESCVRWGDDFCRHGHDCEPVTPDADMTDSNEAAMDKVEVEQCDRDAAGRWWRAPEQERTHAALVNLLARHRLTASEPLLAQVEGEGKA